MNDFFRFLLASVPSQTGDGIFDWAAENGRMTGRGPMPTDPVRGGYDLSQPEWRWGNGRGGVSGALSTLNDAREAGVAIGQQNADMLIDRLPAFTRSFANSAMYPPAHSLGWPYPGFNSDLHESLGIPQATSFGVLPNAMVYGHEHPETTIGGQISQGAPEFLDWLRNNNPMGWGR